MSQPPIPYHVQLTGVREVTLVGTADLAFWGDRLRPAGLYPANVNGKAEALIITCASRFMLVPFREVSFSILLTRREGGADRDGAYLLQAFNSVRFFAWCERVLFGTPYFTASVQVEAGPPATARVTRGAADLFAAEMGPGREPAPVAERGWQGPVFLPARKQGQRDGEKVFFASVGGPTRVYPFLATDRLTFRPPDDHPALELLRQSGLTITEWHVREAATHAKSKTVARGAVGL